MYKEIIQKFLEKDEKIIWSLEDIFGNQKYFQTLFLFNYLIIIFLMFFVFRVSFIDFEQLTGSEVNQRYFYFIIFILMFLILTFLVRKKFPIKINPKYFLTNLRFIILYYTRAEVGGYQIRAYSYSDIIKIKILKNIQKDIFAVRIFAYSEVGLISKSKKVFEEDVALDKKGLEILKEKLVK